MSKISQLKQQFGLVTAGELPERPKPEDDHDKVRERWSPEKKLAFRSLKPAALCIVATEGPVSVTTYAPGGGGAVKARFGHNRGCWPMRTATTASWDDRITESYDKNPFVWTGVQIRVWATSEAKRDKLVEPVTEVLAIMAEEALGAQLRKGWRDVGPEIDMAMLEMQIHAVADRLGFAVRDDDGLSAYLDQVVEMSARKAVGAKG